MQKTWESSPIHVAVDLLIATVRDGKLGVLLSRRPEAPYQGCWALPGRILPLDESAETAAEGLLAEMLPMKDVYMEQLFTFTSVNRDPRGRVISIAYLVAVPWQQLEGCLTRPDVKLKCFTAIPDPHGLSLITPEGAPLGENQLAFDHEQILCTGIQRLQGKIIYSELGFRFLNRLDAFSLRELQMVFEAILGEEIDKSNFRRSILSRYEAAGRIRQTENIHKSGRGRPAVLYCYHP